MSCEDDAAQTSSQSAAPAAPDAAPTTPTQDRDASDASSPADAAAQPDAAHAAAAQPKASQDAARPDAQQPEGPLRVVLFSRTLGYRHTSIEPAQAALAHRLDAARYTLHHTEDPAELARRLPESDVVVFLMTTGDVLGAAEQVAFEKFVRAGGGFVGVHSAADTEYDWPFYGELIVAWFESHPVIQDARVVVEAPHDSVVSMLPNPWQHRDEWYNFRINPRGRAEILLRVDESSYQGGTMGQDHPLAWHHEVDRGRAVYTELGHTDEAWQDPVFLQHIEAAVRWAGRRSESASKPTGK